MNPILETVIGFATNFLLYGALTALAVAIGAAVFYPIFIRKFFPIPFIVYKNAGGAKGNDSIVLYGKITRRGRIMNTKYGQRVKIRGVKDTLPMTLLSRENAIPWEAGGVAFIVYEKEVGQYFPVDPHLRNMEFLDDGNKERGKKLELLHQKLIEKYPDLDGYIRVITPKKATQISPVIFANESVKLQPVPVDMITQYSYDMLARRDRIIKQSFFEKYGTMLVGTLALMTIIVVAVLSFEQVNKASEDRLSQIQAANNDFAQDVARYLDSEQTPPPGTEVTGAALPFLPFLLRKRKKGGLAWLTK